MRPLYWILIIIGVLISILAGDIITTRVIFSPPLSWWWTFGLLIIYGIIGLIIGIIYLVKFIGKKAPQEAKLTPQEAEAIATKKVLYDDSNPDNFIRTRDYVIQREGDEGKERTPILWLSGKGTETLDKIDLLINLNKPNQEILDLRNKTDEEVQEAIKKFAENPVNKIMEKRVVGRDDLGMPTTTIETTKMSSSEQPKQEEKKEGNQY